MHFPIIQLSEQPLEKKDWITTVSMEDDCIINRYTDYIGDRYTEEERYDMIKNHLPYLFNGIASVDIKNQTITFLSKEKIKKTLEKEVEKILDAINSYQKERGVSFFPFRYHGAHFRMCDTLLWFDGCAYTSASFMEDAVYYEGKTLYIGAIYDAHY